MAAFHGKNGAVTWDTIGTDNIVNWTLDITGDLEEITSMTDTYKTYVATFKNWTATVESIFDDTGFDPDIANDLADSDGATLILDTGGRIYTGVAIVTNISPSIDKDGVARVTYNFQGNGSLAETA